MPLSQTGAELLFEIFSQRHERGSTIVTSNLPFEEWTSIFGSQRLTGAPLDRLTHHIHILELNGESYRLKQSTARRRREARSADSETGEITPLPERRVRPGCETPAISAGADRRVVFDPSRKPACSSSGPLADVYSAVDKVYNRDNGYVEAIDLEVGDDRFRRTASNLAYATTIHKSQGSEYPAVVIPVTTQHYMMLQRNLLYTGVTRGKQLVILLGQKKAVAIAVKNVSGRRRGAKQREWLNPVSLRIV